MSTPKPVFCQWRDDFLATYVDGGLEGDVRLRWGNPARGNVMVTNHMPYVHLLQFLCRRCRLPLVFSIRSEGANLEEIDADTYQVECQCGWSGNLLGVEAARHWVALNHNGQQLINHLQGVRDERLSTRS